MKTLNVLAAVVVTAVGANASPLLYDMGTEKSGTWEGFTRVTAGSVYTDTAGFGWKSKDGLKASARVFKSGDPGGPPMWTNPITEDVIAGERENSFLIKAEPGDYEIYIVCGASDASRDQFYDFTVEVAGQRQRVQIEGAYQFKPLRFKAHVGQGPLVVKFSPRSKFLVNAIMAWRAADAGHVREKILVPFEEWTWRMPPSEWAKWKQTPEPSAGVMPPLTAADKERGYVVYSRPYVECIYPHTMPRAEELNPELRAFATPGEYEPLNFIIHPLRDLAGARVTVSDIGPIQARNVEVRRVRYMRAMPNYTTKHRWSIVPDVLERFDALDLKSGENERFWLTVHVPDTTPAGSYAGKVTFTCTGGKAVTLPVRLKILPIKLRDDPAKIFGIYYNHPLDRMSSAKDEFSREYFRRKAEAEHADMVAHGTRNVVLSIWCRGADAQGHFKFDWDTLAAKIELWRKFDFTGPVVMGISTGEVYQKYMKERFGSHLNGVKDPPPEFEREMTALVTAIESERKRRGWPEFLYYPYDEPHTDPAAVSFMVKVLRACKAAGVRTYVTADPTHDHYDPMRPYIDVWSTQPFAPDREAVLADTKARKVEYWCYPNHVAGENDHTPVAGARMTYGFGFWRSGFRALIPWIYSSSSGDQFNYLDAEYMDFFNRQEPDGTPVPVALWEAYREGYDDYRYIYTLERLIDEARRSAKPAAQRAAETAARELASVWNSIRVQPKYKNDDLWSPAEFDVYRWIVAQQILAVQAAL
ncbi:MAG: hypothetical protein WCS99_08085 [Limisphaerales bacterium]